jgi:hypothetical protein
MTRILRAYVIPAALSLLPSEMASPEAAALLLAIAQQESGCIARTQMDGGPARGYWQAEQGGMIRGVLGHPQTADLARALWRDLDYHAEPTAWAVYDAVQHNDVLAAGIARLGLLTLPGALPDRADVIGGWRQYLAAWRPGKPRPNDWPASWRIGWEA